MTRHTLVSVLILCIQISACDSDVSIELQEQTQNLQVNATITSIEFDVDGGKTTYFGSAAIINTSDEPQDYSNRWLWLKSGKSLSARAYLRSLASHQVDMGPIKLAPKESLNLELYWVFLGHQPERLSDSAIELVLRPATERNVDDDVQAAIINYYGFEIERITGIHEEEIEQLGCLFSARLESIENALVRVNSSDANYKRSDVRAKIEMHGKPYFVDRAGIVRQGDDYFQLDRAQFVASISSVRPCD